jgi:hypothetical protein
MNPVGVDIGIPLSLGPAIGLVRPNAERPRFAAYLDDPNRTITTRRS